MVEKKTQPMKVVVSSLTTQMNVKAVNKMKKLILILSLLAFTSCVAVGPRCTYTQDGTKISSWIWFTKEIPVDLSKDNCN